MNEYGKLSPSVLSLSRTIRTITNSDHYIVQAHALSRDLKPIIVHGGFERGMTDNGQPCWSEHTITQFKTAEEALHYSKHLGRQRWGFMVDVSTVQVKRVVTRTIEYRDEYTVEEADRLIQEHNDGFKRYMESR